MLVTMVGGGILVGVLLALVAGSYWAEEVLWKGWKGFWSNRRLIFPGYKEHAALHHTVYDVDGLAAQLKDLKKVLELTRTSLNEANQACGEQMGRSCELRECLNVSEHIRADQGTELRKRAIAIRHLGGVLPRRKRK